MTDHGCDIRYEDPTSSSKESLTGADSIIVSDPSLWMPPGEMAAKVDRSAEKAKGARRRPEVEEILPPG